MKDKTVISNNADKNCTRHGSCAAKTLPSKAGGKYVIGHERRKHITKCTVKVGKPPRKPRT